MSDINIGKLRKILDEWKKANIPGSNIDLNKLADDTLKAVDGEPLIKEICQAFLYSVSIHAIKDPNFDNPESSSILDKSVVSKSSPNRDTKRGKKK